MHKHFATAAVIIALAGPALADPATASWNIDALTAIDGDRVADTLFTPFALVGEGFTTAGDWVASQISKL